MAKTFYTERDIEELARHGGQSLTVSDDVGLTDLAVEKAHRLGVALVRQHDTPPSAPVRPYIAVQPKSWPAGATSPEPPPAPKPDLQQRVREAVIARLGSEIDPPLLDAIIRRVLDNVGVR